MAQNSCPACPETLSESDLSEASRTNRKRNRTSGSTTCDVQRPYVQVEHVEVPYYTGFERDVWTNKIIMNHFECMAHGAAQAQTKQDDQDMRPAADDERQMWDSFSTHYQDPDGKMQVLHGLHVDFQKRLAHEVWDSGDTKTWKMDYEYNNETRSLLEMFWNQTERKVWMKWKIAPSDESENKKLKVTTITTSHLDEVEG